MAPKLSDIAVRILVRTFVKAESCPRLHEGDRCRLTSRQTFQKAKSLL